MQMQAAMSLPLRRLVIAREGVYNLLAFLRRYKASRSPRAVRFELEPGKPPVLVLEPWEKVISLHSPPYLGTRAETVRVWGRDRLRVLARQLPLLEQVDVYLLGTGLPSFWVTRMGEIQMVLGLSGWTTNNWTGASALTQLLPPVDVGESQLASIAATFRHHPAQSLDEVVRSSDLDQPTVVAGLNRLALLGQVIYDLTSARYRWRQVMPTPLTMEQIGSDDVETRMARELLRGGSIRTTKDEQTSAGLRLLSGAVNDN